MLEIWLDEKHLDTGELQAVQNDKTLVPCNIGRRPFRIGKSFAGSTAEQWKLWTCVFSLFAFQCDHLLIKYISDLCYNLKDKQ